MIVRGRNPGPRVVVRISPPPEEVAGRADRITFSCAPAAEYGGAQAHRARERKRDCRVRCKSPGFGNSFRAHSSRPHGRPPLAMTGAAPASAASNLRSVPRQPCKASERPLGLQRTGYARACDGRAGGRPGPSRKAVPEPFSQSRRHLLNPLFLHRWDCGQ